jgi:hypothetical protein
MLQNDPSDGSQIMAVPFGVGGFLHLPEWARGILLSTGDWVDLKAG